jgi:hypothetical protein
VLPFPVDSLYHRQSRRHRDELVVVVVLRRHCNGLVVVVVLHRHCNSEDSQVQHNLHDSVDMDQPRSRDEVVEVVHSQLLGDGHTVVRDHIRLRFGHHHSNPCAWLSPNDSLRHPPIHVHDDRGLLLQIAKMDQPRCSIENKPEPITPSPFKSTPNFFSTCFVKKSNETKRKKFVDPAFFFVSQ